MKLGYLAALAVLINILCAGNITAQHMQLVSASDCVSTKYLLDGWHYSPIKINPQGTLFAYLVKAPDLETNENNIELYVDDVEGSSKNSARLLFKGRGISHLEWTRDGRYIVIQAREGKYIAVDRIDSLTAKRKVLAHADRDIREYTVDENADTVVFAVDSAENDSIHTASAEEKARGYRISFEQSSYGPLSRDLYLTRSLRNGVWTRPTRISIQSPVSHRTVNTFDYFDSLRLSLSPNGRRLLFQYEVGDEIPEDWKQDAFVQKLFTQYGFSGQLTMLYDTAGGRTTLAFKSLYTLNVPVWSPDSRSFLVASYPPVDSSWWPKESAGRVVFSDLYDLFWVQPETGQEQLVRPHLASTQEQPLFWDGSNRLILYNGRGAIEELQQNSDGWSKESTFAIPTATPLRQARLATDGKHFIGEYQDISTPPELFKYLRGDNGVQIISTLNPQMQKVVFAKTQTVHWRTSTGYGIQGVLFTPPDFIPGHRYPLVIQTKPYYGQFVCDTGESHYPSFAPQPMAAAGILYLVRGSILPDDDLSETSDLAHYPSGYPGNIGEAAFNMDVWESAVDTLQAQGLVDPNNVGIIGFSRTGWYTEFALVHSRIHYKAATAADNVEYGLNEYWSIHSPGVIRGWESTYGGPPYGATLKNWLDYSVSFNFEKIHTPILMEEMGKGVAYTSAQSIPADLVNHFDLFTGLNRLNKAVELYYYPDEDHAPEDPKARLGSLQRNVDWYRFWLQGYERPNPEDPDQYKRWEHLGELRDTDAKSSKPVSKLVTP
jgi:dipeptidyl aminopeptidase/acylaminoacyl peptidase